MVDSVTRMQYVVREDGLYYFSPVGGGSHATLPWGTVIELSDRWQDIVVPLDQLRFFPHWAHPANRGGPEDRFHPENVESVNFCFGAWLFGDRAAQPHGTDLAE